MLLTIVILFSIYFQYLKFSYEVWYDICFFVTPNPIHNGGSWMKDYRIPKDAEMKLHEMMLYPEIRMAIQSETVDRSIFTSPAGKSWMSRRRKEKDGTR